MQRQEELQSSSVFKYLWWIWRFYGLQPPAAGSKWRWPYLVHTVVINFSVTLLFPLSLSINCFLSKNLKDLCENLHLTVTDLICNMKFLNLYCARANLLSVVPILKQLDLRANSPAEIQCIQRGMHSVKRLFLAFSLLFSCAIISSQLMVICSSERNLMYPEWFPWDWKSSKRNFLFAHAYQSYAILLQAILNWTNDTYPPAYLTILSAHVAALGTRIRKIGRNRTNKEASEEEQLAAFEELVGCVKDQKRIYELLLTIQKIISTTCLGQFICTGLAQCTITIYILHSGLNVSKLLNMLLFFSAVTFETFVLCYYGDLLCQEFENLTDAIYACNWIDQNKKFRSALLLLLQRSQKIHVIMAGNIIPIRLPTFLKVMKTTYSLFTLLNKFK